MKTILFLLILHYSFSILSQEKEYDPTTNSKSSKFTLGFVYSPERSFRTLREGIDSDQSTAGNIEGRNANEIPNFGQSGSIFLGYELSRIYTIESGIGYTSFGETTKPEIIHYIATENFPELIFTKYTIKRFHLISLPINLHANFGGNRLRGFLSAGIAPGYLCQANYIVHQEYENGDKTKQTISVNDSGKFSKFILLAQVSGGIDFRYSKKASLRIAPAFKITTNSVYTTKEIKGNYFNIGINVGMTYKL